MPELSSASEVSRTRPTATGVLLALTSATAFGVTIPVLAWSGASVGVFSTACLLYVGASLSALLQKPLVREAGAPLRRSSWGPLLIMAVAGAAVAPTLLAWGIQHIGPVTGGLLLNLEAVWTVVFARIAFGEFLGRRVVVALALMTVGGVVLSMTGHGGPGWSALGAAAVLGATVGWAIDNTASRQLAELRPLTVVAAKGALGATVTASLALIFDERLPSPAPALALLLAGATGYGVSLRLYLQAQRRIGAARTASVFALAPFIGAALGLVLVPTALELGTGAAAALFAVGVGLHVSERHAHAHRHDPIQHDHAHRHDDGHHVHPHELPAAGEHSHPHAHGSLEHTHEHGQDVHHGHSH